MAPTYQVWLKDAAGARGALFDGWQSLSYVKHINVPGSYALMIDGGDDRIALFVLDSQIEVWRKDETAGLDWYLDFEGLHRIEERALLASGQRTYTSKGVGYLELLNRRIIVVTNGGEGDKAGAAETVLKGYVYDQAGAGAAVARQTTGLSLQADLGRGNIVMFKRAYRNLLEVCQDVALAGEIDFDIEGTGAAAFDLRCYSLRGQDRTAGNTAGNAPVVFSTAFGNLRDASYTYNRQNEINYIYVGGSGTGITRTIEPVTDATKTDDSPWNRREVWRDQRNEGVAAGLTSTGEAVLAEEGARPSLTPRVLQIPSCAYGVHYGLGDLVTIRFDEITMNKQIVEMRVSVKGNGETVEVMFAGV